MPPSGESAGEDAMRIKRVDAPETWAIVRIKSQTDRNRVPRRNRSEAR